MKMTKPKKFKIEKKDDKVTLIAHLPSSGTLPELRKKHQRLTEQLAKLVNEVKVIGNLLDANIDNDDIETVFEYEVLDVHDFTLGEFMRQFDNMNSDLKFLETKRQELEQQIESKKLDNDLALVNINISDIQSVISDSEKMLGPLRDEIQKSIRRKVLKQKVDKGYSRVSNTNDRITMQNQILGPLASEFDIDMNDPIIRQIKTEFDKI